MSSCLSPSGDGPFLRRNRFLLVCLMAVTITLGLLSRRYASLLPWWLAKNAGDVLYATMAYWLMGFLFPSLSRRWVFAAATVFCFLIEFSQLDQTPWLVTLRRYRLGGLILGYGFHISDLACYVLGALLGLLIDCTAFRKHRTEKEQSR